MGETQHFCLRWNNYQSSITSAFENLRDDEDFVDVTLACEGRSIKAHRVVLSACSPYFRDLLKSTPCQHPVILLQDVNFLDLHALVEFIYHGEVNVHQKSLQSFLKTAEVLRVSGLTQRQAEDTHNQLAEMQNLANAEARTNPHLNAALHGATLPDESPLCGGARNSTSPPPGPPVPPGPPTPTQLPALATSHIGDPNLFKRSMESLLKRYTPTGGIGCVGGSIPGVGVGVGVGVDTDLTSPMKRLRAIENNGCLSGNSNLNSPDIIHTRSDSPQLTPTDFSTIKHHNNNNTPPLKDEKRNGPTGVNNNNNISGNGISIAEKFGSMTPSPLARPVTDDVKSEPMELVMNNNPQSIDEHSNDSTGEQDVNRSSSVDGGKGSLSSGQDEEIENNIPQHPPPFLIGASDSKLFPPTPFNFAMDPAALAGFNAQLHNAAELAVSPQGPHNLICSAATSPSSSASSPPSPPAMQPCSAMTSPTGSLNAGVSPYVLQQVNNSGNCNANMNASPPRPDSAGLGIMPSSNTSNFNGANGGGGVGNGNGNAPGQTPQLPLRMPPPTSGGINEPQECPYCRRTFSCYYSLKRHFQDKHEQSDTLYVCEFCHRRYRTKNSLTTHKSLQHRGSSGMLKRLLKTSAIKNVLVPHPHHHHHHHHHAGHHAAHPALGHPRTGLFDFTSELGQPPPGIQ